MQNMCNSYSVKGSASLSLLRWLTAQIPLTSIYSYLIIQDLLSPDQCLESEKVKE